MKGFVFHHESNHKHHEYTKRLCRPDCERIKLPDCGWVLSSYQMQFLRNNPYYYCATAGSYLELVFLQRFWTKLSIFIPRFIAPSLLTFTGLAINVLCSFNVLYFSPDLKHEVPSWAFLICAIALFLYQTLDALDGKQAAKVQNTQIEELTDHGCDAVSTIFLTLTAAAALQLGNHTLLLYLFSILTFIAFFSTHWLAHLTHCMVFKKLDVSEAQWTMILVHLVTARWGQTIWSLPIVNVYGNSVTAAQVVTILAIVSLLNCLYDNVRMSVFGKKTPLEENGVMIPRRQSSTVFNPLYPLGLLCFFSILNYISGLGSLSPTVFLLLYGFAFARLTIALVMTNVSRGDMDRWDSCLVAPLLLTLNQSLIGLIHPYTALLCASIYSIMDFARYFTYSCWDLKTALDLYIFSIKYPIGHPKNRGGNDGFYMNGLNTKQVQEDWKKFEAKEGNGLVKELFSCF